MLFVSFNFLIFFISVYLIFWMVPTRYRQNILLVSSLIFYASWSIAFTFHFLFIILINYYGIELYRKYRNNTIFFAIQFTNITNLLFFKYFYFIAGLLSKLSGIGFLAEPVLRNSHREMGFEIMLPLAISFYTFQIMSYGIDIRRGNYTNKHTLRDVILYVTFFPQLISGPIMRASDLLPQITAIDKNVKPDSNRMAKGLWLILIGVSKKVFIADMIQMTFSPILMDPSRTAHYYPHAIWIIMFALLIMLYADFSAYTDMARGCGFMIGIDIPENFRAPFKMHSFTELWKRWHLTFSTWIRDYIFIPLGGSRQGEIRLYLNLIFAFFLAGLWHGATITFAFWGLLMGLFLSIEAFLKKLGYNDMPETRIGKFIRIPLVWIMYISTGVFFFAPDWSNATHTFWKMFRFNDYTKELTYLPKIVYVKFLLAFIGVVIFQTFEEHPTKFTWLRKYEQWLLPTAAIILITGLTQIEFRAQEFFYFQF